MNAKMKPVSLIFLLIFATAVWGQRPPSPPQPQPGPGQPACGRVGLLPCPVAPPGPPLPAPCGRLGQPACK